MKESIVPPWLFWIKHDANIDSYRELFPSTGQALEEMFVGRLII